MDLVELATKHVDAAVIESESDERKLPSAKNSSGKSPILQNATIPGSDAVNMMKGNSCARFIYKLQMPPLCWGFGGGTGERMCDSANKLANSCLFAIIDGIIRW